MGVSSGYFSNKCKINIICDPFFKISSFLLVYLKYLHFFAIAYFVANLQSI